MRALLFQNLFYLFLPLVVNLRFRPLKVSWEEEQQVVARTFSAKLRSFLTLVPIFYSTTFSQALTFCFERSCYSPSSYRGKSHQLLIAGQVSISPLFAFEFAFADLNVCCAFGRIKTIQPIPLPVNYHLVARCSSFKLLILAVNE